MAEEEGRLAGGVSGVFQGNRRVVKLHWMSFVDLDIWNTGYGLGYNLLAFLRDAAELLMV